MDTKTDRFDAMSQVFTNLRLGVRVHDVDLRGRDLGGADLSGLRADRVDFRNAALHDATMRAVRLGECQADECRCERTDWTGATLRRCTLDGAHAAGTRFDAARIEDSTADGIDLSCASLRGAHLSETSFNRAVMREAVLDDADGEGVEFRGADLRGAMLIGSRFDAADFRGADLRGADLSRGRFRSADFRGAMLEDAKFDDADCAAAQFDADSDPHAPAQRNDPAATGTRIDDTALATLRELMAQLPSLLATGEGPASELLAQLKAASPILDAASSSNAEEWKAWAERLITSGTMGQPTDLRAVLSALTDAPIGLRRGAAAVDPRSVSAVVDQLQASIETLGSTSDHPPEEWQPVLRALMRMTAGDRPVDLQTLLDHLASIAKPGSPATGSGQS
jgi:uncharacterized protein YjbI with pentapeptide repeats